MFNSAQDAQARAARHCMDTDIVLDTAADDESLAAAADEQASVWPPLPPSLAWGDSCALNDPVSRHSSSAS